MIFAVFEGKSIDSLILVRRKCCVEMTEAILTELQFLAVHVQPKM
jgi:hypothetical protein